MRRATSCTGIVPVNDFNSRAATVDRVYGLYRQELKVFFKRRLWRPGSADDAVQIVYLRLLNSPGLSEVRDPTRFIYRIAWRALYDQNQRDRYEKYSTVSIESDESQESLAARSRLWKGEDDSTEDVDHADFKRAIETLRPEQQLVFVLHYIDGNTIAEVSLKTGIAPNTVKKYLKQAMARLYNWYGAGPRRNR